METLVLLLAFPGHQWLSPGEGGLQRLGCQGADDNDADDNDGNDDWDDDDKTMSREMSSSFKGGQGDS